ncbi:MAG TPA: hypothetical protein DCE41_22680 [Cytophagales bacterium]|nr:hypothetical protein [Cytophagales bacterium]
MENANEYMMIFRYTPKESNTPTPEEQAASSAAWGTFIGNIAIAEKLVSTHQLGFESRQIAADGSLTEGVHLAEGQTLGGNMIVKANTLEEAVSLAKESPILAMGGTVEVRSIVPM